MKRIVPLVIALLISINASPLLAKNDDNGIIIRKAKNTVIPQEQPGGEEQDDLAQDTPSPLTEEEQTALVQKMNLPGMQEENKTETIK